MVKTRILKYIVLILFISFTSELVFGSMYSKKHFVFFIHGIGGNAESFGKMPEYLPRHLYDLQYEYKYSSHIYTYPTEDDHQGTTKFAMDFSKFIDKTVSENTKAGEDYRISVVAHSQGGIVTTIWYYRTLIQDKNFQSKNIEKLHTVITLGTPFWGSKLALLATSKWGELIWWFDKNYPGKLGMLSRLGKKQLKDMAYTSDVLQAFRMNLDKVAPVLEENKLSNIRFLNITGNANLKVLTQETLKEKSNWFTKFLPFVFGKVEYESDGAVLMPSSTLNTLYHKNILKDYVDGGNNILSYKEYKLADRLFVKTVHASSTPEELSDMCYLQEYCESWINCKHPTYKYVLDYFLGKDVPTHAENVKYHNFGGFTIDLNVHLPEGHDHLKEEVSVAFNLPGENIKKHDLSHHIQVGNPLEIASREKKIETRIKNMVSFWYTGHIFRKGENALRINKEHPLPRAYKVVEAVISAPGMKTRKVRIKVRPTISSYVEVNLVPKLK